MTYAAEVLADSPSGYWRFNEGDPPFEDETAGNRDATIKGTNQGALSMLEPGIAHSTGLRWSWDQAAAFGPYIEIPAGVLSSPTSWTYELWFRTDRRVFSGDTVVLLGIGGGETSRVSIFSFGTPVPTFWVRGFSSTGAINATRDSSLLKADKWYHCVVVFTTPATSIGIDIYMNGALDNQGSNNLGTSGHLIPSSGQAIDLNFRNNGDTFGGYIDEVAVYPAVLSASRIAAHYDAAVADDVFAGNGHVSSKVRPRSRILVP